MAVAIATIVILAVYYGVVYQFGRVTAGQRQTGLQQDADNAVYWIELVLREGSWAYLDGDAANSLTVDNFAEGLQKRIYVDGTRLLVDSAGQTHQVVDNLSELTFSVYLDRVDYELAVTDGSDTVRLSSSKQLRNVPCVGLWHFSEGSGDVTYDTSANNNNAALYGASWTSGQAGRGLRFDGIDDCLRVPDNPDLDSGQRIAVGAAVQPEGSGPRTIIARQAASGERIHVYLDAGAIHYAFGSAMDVASDSLSWQSGQWHEICVQHDGPAGRIHFYRDGQKVGSATGSLPPLDDGDLWIGSRGGTGDFWDGKLDEVRFASY